MNPSLYLSVRQRLAAKTRQAANGCAEYDGARDKDGYGRIKIGGFRRRAHRVAYELTNGPFDESLFVCHRCDNPSCVNPEHLFLGTNADNMRDAKAKGRLRPPYGSVTHCRRGHEFTPDNTIKVKTGRECRTCRREHHRPSQAGRAMIGGVTATEYRRAYKARKRLERLAA